MRTAAWSSEKYFSIEYSLTSLRDVDKSADEIMEMIDVEKIKQNREKYLEREVYVNTVARYMKHRPRDKF